jgi:hypothetical protein
MAMKRGKPLARKTRLKPVSAKRKANPASKLRLNAEGQNCTLRLEGCRSDPQYTVLAHLRRFGWGGMGMKPNDLLAVFACDLCHEKQERYHPLCSDKEVLRALGETIMVQMQNGIIRIAGDD